MKKKKCYYCGLKNSKIEAEGIWYCPNALCSGPGAAWFRRTLKSYKDIDLSHHEINLKELKLKGWIKNILNKIFYFKSKNEK